MLVSTAVTAVSSDSLAMAPSTRRSIFNQICRMAPIRTISNT